MTPQHRIAALITVLLMCLGNLSIANDLSEESAVEVAPPAGLEPATQ